MKYLNFRIIKTAAVISTAVYVLLVGGRIGMEELLFSNHSTDFDNLYIVQHVLALACASL